MLNRIFTRLPVAGITIILALLVSAGISAKQLYKYQDENGVWHFSDLPPDTELPVEVRPMRVDPTPRLEMSQQGEKSNPDYWFENQYNGPMEIEVSFLKKSNVNSKPRLPKRFILAPKEHKKLVEIQPFNPAKSWDFQLSYRWVPGDPRARHRPDVLYLPPFAVGESYWITQGENDRDTHTTPDSMHAVDLGLPEGTPVLAARAGIVMDVEDDFFSSGQNLERFGDRANIVRILHADGTMAIYAHLQLDSIRVHAGKVVLAGERIALSGNTGYSSGPHLHFAVQRNAGMQLVSVPIVFKGEGGSSVRPLSKTRLTAFRQTSSQ